MNYTEFSAKSLEEAITLATVELGITSDCLEYEVVDKGSGGILGFGRKDVTIKARKKGSEEESVLQQKKEDTQVKEEIHAVEDTHEHEEKPKANPDEVKQVALDFLRDVFKTMELDVNSTMDFSEENQTLSIDLSGPQMGLLIGKRGQTLDALQFLINLVVNKHSKGYVRVKLDTEDYRNRRKETLENLARNIASKVKRTGKNVSLEAMNPYERRTIHYALQNDDAVETFSEGTEPYRHVVVTLKK